jgi:hypothetical protein
MEISYMMTDEDKAKYANNNGKHSNEAELKKTKEKNLANFWRRKIIKDG